MTKRFLDFIPFILKWEASWPEDKSGQYSNDPDDPGGETRWGIDKKSHPSEDIAHLSYDRAVGIYYAEWTSEKIESLPINLGEAYYNACVNCGLGRAEKLRASSHDATSFIVAQEQFYRNLVEAKPKLKKFLPGWLNRTADLRKYLRLV